jgi:Polysaccharide lyase
LLHEAPNAITEVPNPLGGGETVFKFTVGDDDVAPITPTENPRAEALSPALIEPGSEIWLKTKFMLPENFPSVPGWMSLVSIYGPPFNGPSPWRIGVGEGGIQWQRNGTYGYDIPWQIPLVREKWVTVLLHERFATDGWVEMWIDGQAIAFFSQGTYNPSNHPPTGRLEMATADSSNNGGPDAAKIMQYREVGMFETATVYFGSLQVGKTRASVGG